MLHLTHRALLWILRLGLIGLILVAALTTALRLALPVADGYRDELTRTLSERLGYPLRVATLTLRLAGWSPRLVLGDVVITCPKTDRDLLRLRALELDLDPLASLRAGQPRLRSLTLVGAHLAVHRALDGQVSLIGLTALTPDDPDALAIFLRQGRLNLTEGDIMIIDDALDGAVVRLTQVRLRLHNDGPVHQLELLAHPVAASADARNLTPDDAQLRLLADLRGDAGDTRQWDGDLYLRLAGANLAALVPWTLLDPDQARSRSVDLESWNQLQRGALVESRNRISLRGVTLRRPATGGRHAAAPAPSVATDRHPTPPAEPAPTSAQAPPADRPGPTTDQAPPSPVDAAPAPAEVALERLDALVRVTPAQLGWRVQVADLGLAVSGAEIADLSLDLQLSAHGQPRALDLAGARLDLQALTRLLSAWPAAPLDQHLIAALNPHARVEQLAARVAFPTQGPPTWQAAALVRGLRLERHARIPGLTGLSARLQADQDGGEMQLDSDGLELDLRPLFDPALHLDQFHAALDWRRSATGGWRLTSNQLALENLDLAGQARFTLDLPGPAEPADTGPFLDLRAGFQDGEVAHTRRYLPVGVLKPPLVDWLTRALKSGRVSRGDLVLRGPLKQYPFRAQQGCYELILRYRDLVLDYHQGWPPIEAAAGELYFFAQGLDIRMDTGRLYGTTLTQGQASLPDLWAPHRLPIHAAGSGPFADGLKILTQTPLVEHLGPLAHALEVEGPMQLVLDLDVPLGKGEIPGVGVDGRLSWPAPAGLSLKGTPIKLTGLAGELGFTGNALHADAIRAQLWGRPATLAINTQNPAEPAAATTEIRAHSRTPVAVLATRFPSPFWRLTTGDVEWDLGVDLHNADLKEPALPLAYSLTSDLRGLALSLPAPLGKTAERARPLAVTGTLIAGRSLSVAGTAEPLAWDLALALAPARLERGRITLGATPGAAPTAAAPPAPGLTIDGSLGELNLPAWSDWWTRSAAGLAIPTNPGPDPAANPDADPMSFDLRIARLDLGGPALTEARVQAAPAAGGWDLDLESQELKGQLQVPGGGGATPWVLNLDRLDLKALLPAAPDAGATPSPTTVAAAPARRPPTLDLKVAQLRWGEAELGRLSLALRPDAAGIQVSRIALDGAGDTQVTGDAQWLDSPTGGRGRLALNLRSANTAPLLRALDYSPLLSPATVDGRLRLDWPGGFAALSLARGTGRIELDVGPGRLLEVDPGVGRVLGFLNLGELNRRLALDFTDLYEQGFVFERITGRIAIGNGQARLETFAIDGPASDIRVSGSADLRARTFDQTVTVEPSIGTTVALASGVAGGPVVGAAVYLVDRLTGGGLDRLASYQYRMTGPWAKPELTRLGWEPFARGASPGLGNAAATTPQGSRSGTQDGPAATGRPRPGRDNRFLE